MTFRVNDTAELLYGDPSPDGEGLASILLRQGKILDCNERFFDLFGGQLTDYQGRAVSQIFQDTTAFQQFSQLLAQRLNAGHATINWPFKQGQRELHCRVCVQKIALGAPEGLEIWLIEDLSQRVVNNEKLTQKIRELDALLRNAPVGIIYTAQRKLTRANPQFCSMFGYSESEVLELSGRDLFPSDEVYSALGHHAFPRLSSGQSMAYEAPMRRANGEIFWAKLIAYVLNPQNTQEGTIWIITDESNLREHQAQIEAALLENQIILDSAVVGIIYLRERKIVRCNPMAEQIFGYGPGEMLGLSTRTWYESEEAFKEVAEKVYPAIRAGERYTQEYRMRRRDGTPFWCRISGQILDKDNPILGPSIWILEDTSERHADQEALFKANALMKAALDSAKVSIISCDAQGIIQMANPTALGWLGYRPDELVGQAIQVLLHDGSGDDGNPLRSIEASEIFEEARQQGVDSREWLYLRKDGSQLPIHLTTSVLRNAQGEISGYVSVGVDISDRFRVEEALRSYNQKLESEVRARTAELDALVKVLQSEINEREAVEAQIRIMAHFDTLTGLPNRNLFNELLQRGLAAAQRDRGQMALMFIDLDRFKQINDTLGHEVGDHLLRLAARRMADTIRGGDTLARFGGDEFVLLCPDVRAKDDLSILAERLLACFVEDFAIGAHRVRTSPSIGIARYPEDGLDSDSLLRHADLAMYEAKLGGKNTFRFYSAENGHQSA